jgi:hypothetical protein
MGYIAITLYRYCLTALPAGARPACDVVEALLACAGVVWGWINGRRRLRAAREQALSAKESWAQRRAVTGLAQSRAGGWFLIAAPVLPALVAYAAGELCAEHATKEFPSEVGARRELVAKGLPARPV